MQHQVLGSDQWTALVTGLREPAWAATGLKKGIQHIFRVLSSSGKSSSKPSAPSEPVQLLEHGEPDAVWMGIGMGSEMEAPRLPGPGNCSMDSVAWQDPIPSVVGSGLATSLGAFWLCSISLNLSFSVCKTGALKEYRRGEGAGDDNTKGTMAQCQPSTEPVFYLPAGPPLEEAPAVLDKQDIVYVVEGQPACVTVTFNHVEAQVVWRRYESLLPIGPYLGSSSPNLTRPLLISSLAAGEPSSRRAQVCMN